MRRGIVAFVFFLFSAFTIAPELAARDQLPDVLWSKRIGRYADVIKTGDLNGDGKPDVVAASRKPLKAIDNTGELLWRFSTNHSYEIVEVAVGDIDGDGHDDVAGVEYQGPYLFAISGSSGAELWRYQLSGVGHGVQIGDVTGDGRNEVIVGDAASNTLFVLDDKGTVLFTHSAPSDILSIVLGDVADGAGSEVIVSYGRICPPSTCGVQVVDGSGNIVWNFSTSVRLGLAVAGDLNADGRADVVVGEYEYGARNVYAIDSSGAFLWKFEQGEPVLGYGSATLALGDIDGDGGLDIVLGSSDHHVYVISAAGQVTWAFAVAGHISQVAVGDLDGDGRNEIAASTIGPKKVGPRGVYAIDSDGTQRWFFPRANVSNVKGFNDLVIADVNGDGRDDVIAVQRDQQDLARYGLAFALSDPR